jgi:hypothetical protein
MKAIIILSTIQATFAQDGFYGWCPKLEEISGIDYILDKNKDD